MTKEQFIDTYLDGIFVIENNSIKSNRHVVFPENCIVLGFQFRNSMKEVINGKEINLPMFSIDGQLTRKKEYISLPGDKILLVKFKSNTASLFFQNLHVLTDQTISLTHVITHEDFEKMEVQYSSKTDKQKIVIDFLQHLLRNQTADKSIVQAINIINETKGQVRVDELAYKVYNSKRNFERKFKVATGLTPKQFIINVRFQHSVNLLQSNNDLIGIAYSSGYYDQSHFIHEFKEITGVTPEKFLA